MSEINNDVHQPRRHMRTAIIAVVLVTLLSIGVVGAVILSNILHLGPYVTNGGFTIHVTQVASPQLPQPCSTNSTYTSATELPTGSGSLTQAIWYKTGIRVEASSGTSFNVNEVYNITYQGDITPGVNDIKLAYCDLLSSTWITLHPTYYSGLKMWNGTVKPAGFVLPVSYDATTPILVSVLQSGIYSVNVWFVST